MEVLRRFKLPDAKSVIPKFGSSNSHQSTPAKERELSAPSATTEDNEHGGTSKKEGGGLGGTELHASTTDADNGQQLVPKRARGKQPIAPKPDENSHLLSQQRSKPPMASSPVSPKSPRPRGPSHGRIHKRPPGRGTINNRVSGATPPAQDPPGNVHRKESIVAAHLRPNGSPGGGSSSTSSSAVALPGSPISTPNSQHGKRSATKKSGTVSKGASADVTQQKSSNDSTPKDLGDASLPPPQSSLPQSRPIGRGPLGMERRPTPAPYVLQSPSGVDAKKATVAVSSLLDAGGGVIGELDGAGADDDGIDDVDEQQTMLMNLETPRIRNVATVVAASIGVGESLPVYPDDPASAAPVVDAVANGDDEASLPDEPHVLATDKHSTSAAGSSNQLMNPNDSTASLGRQSTTSAAIRRRGRSHSRTRRTEQPLPTSVSVSDGTNTAACSNSPTRSVLRSRSSQRRQRRSRSNSRSNRTRTNSREPASAGRDGSASPGGDGGNSVSPSDAARLSPAGGGRRPQRAPPVTKRTHAQKMSMKNAIKAADLDMLATPSVTAPSSSSTSTVMSPTSLKRPNNGAQVSSSPALAAASMAEAARWRAPPAQDNDGPTRELRPATKSVLTPPASVMPTPTSHEDGANHMVEKDAPSGDGPAAGGGTGNAPTTTTKSSNPVRSLAKGLLKRRPSLVSRSADPKVPFLNSSKS